MCGHRIEDTTGSGTAQLGEHECPIVRVFLTAQPPGVGTQAGSWCRQVE